MANPNIALSFKSPQFRSPLDTAARVQQLAANAMAMQKAQRETGSLNALRDYISGGGKLDTPEAISAAIQAGADPDTVRALATQNLDVGKFQADRKKVATGRIFNRLPAVDRAGEAGNDQAWVDWLNAYGALGDEEAAEAKVYLNLTGGKYDPAIVKSLMAGAEKYFEKTTPQAATESIIGEGGEVGVLTRGGLAAPTLVTPKTFEQDMSGGGTVTVEPSQTVEPGVGGPVSADEVERFIQSFPREAQAAIRQRINEGALGEIPMGSPVPTGLVAGERGGVGGPYEGYVEAPRPFRARVPAPPSQPQPRETAEEVGRKEAARLEAQRQAKIKAGPPPPAPMTEAQRLARRDKMAAEMTKAQALINKTFDPKVGIVAAVNKVKSLSKEQKESGTGWSSYVPSLRESSRLADAALSDIKGIVIDLGKSEASDDGGIGNMAVQEWTIVANMIASLDYGNMSPSVLDRQMNIIERRAVNAANLTKQAYEARFRDELKTNPEFKLKIPPPPKTRTPVSKGGARISPDVDNILKGLGL